MLSSPSPLSLCPSSLLGFEFGKCNQDSVGREGGSSRCSDGAWERGLLCEPWASILPCRPALSLAFSQ